MVEVFYLSPSSGTQFNVVIRLKYPYILVNYATMLRDYAKICRKFAKILLIDSGGFPSSFLYNGYNTSDKHYLSFIKTVRADYFVLRDYPCEPQILQKFKVTVKDQIHKTLEHHLKLLELYERSNVGATPIPVIQGWRIHEYLYCLDLFKEHGLIDKFDYIAIGSTCRRHKTKEVRKIIMTLSKELKGKKLHAFGVKLSVLDDFNIWNALYSCDSGAWDFKKPKQNSLQYCLEFLRKLESYKEKFVNSRYTPLLIE